MIAKTAIQKEHIQDYAQECHYHAHLHQQRYRAQIQIAIAMMEVVSNACQIQIVQAKVQESVMSQAAILEHTHVYTILQHQAQYAGLQIQSIILVIGQRLVQALAHHVHQIQYIL